MQSVHENRDVLYVALEEERRRIARELHDDFGQRFCVIQSRLADALARNESMSVAGRQLLEDVADSIKCLSEDLWKVSQQLHPSILEIMSLGDAIDVHVAQFRGQSGLELDFAATSVPDGIPAATAAAFLRITQEALHNAAKHARGSKVTIRLKGMDSKLTLSIRDNGPGLDRARTGTAERLGLKSMAERARLAGARFRINTGLRHGVSILVSVPLRTAPLAFRSGQ